jgi:hypothetical protein
MFEMGFTGLSVNSVIYRQGRLIPEDFYPNEDYLIRALMWRSKENMNSFVLVVGNPRTSKSSFALHECYRLAKLKKQDFNVEEQLTFDDIKKFLVWSQKAEDSQFILDETGTSLSPSQFWEIQAKVMRSFIQTQGFRKNILFWVLPSIVFLQKNFRFLSNYGVKTIQQGLVSVYKICTDQLLGKGYVQYVKSIRFKMVDSAVWDKYNEYKRIWNDDKLKDDIDYINMMDKPSEKEALRQEYWKLRNENLKTQIEFRKNRINETPTNNVW